MSENEPKFNPDDVENKERKNSLDLTWGEGEPTVANYSGNIACITDGCRSYNEPAKNFFHIAIGVKKAPISMQRPNKQFAMVCRCPDCSRSFWFHIRNTEANMYKECYDNGMFDKAKLKE
jgi:hypothetical protein